MKYQIGLLAAALFITDALFINAYVISRIDETAKLQKRALENEDQAPEPSHGVNTGVQEGSATPETRAISLENPPIDNSDDGAPTPPTSGVITEIQDLHHELIKIWRAGEKFLQFYYWIAREPKSYWKQIIIQRKRAILIGMVKAFIARKKFGAKLLEDKLYLTLWHWQQNPHNRRCELKFLNLMKRMDEYIGAVPLNTPMGNIIGIEQSQQDGAPDVYELTEDRRQELAEILKAETFAEYKSFFIRELLDFQSNFDGEEQEWVRLEAGRPSNWYQDYKVHARLEEFIDKKDCRQRHRMRNAEQKLIRESIKILQADIEESAFRDTFSARFLKGEIGRTLDEMQNCGGEPMSYKEHFKNLFEIYKDIRIEITEQSQKKDVSSVDAVSESLGSFTLVTLPKESFANDFEGEGSHDRLVFSDSALVPSDIATAAAIRGLESSSSTVNEHGEASHHFDTKGTITQPIE